MAALLPHSFVLADLFEVVSMSFEVPDHLLEDEPGLGLVPCPECEGEGWLECYGSAWTSSCDLWGRPDLAFTYKPCTRCHGEGVVLALLEPALEAPAVPECERCCDSGWIGAEPTTKAHIRGFGYVLGQSICPCGALRGATASRKAA